MIQLRGLNDKTYQSECCLCSVTRFWLFLKDNGNNFSCKKCPTIWRFLGYFETCRVLNKNCFRYSNYNFWRNLVYFLFQHLVTLLIQILPHQYSDLYCSTFLKVQVCDHKRSKVAFTLMCFTQYASLFLYILNIFAFSKLNNLLCITDQCEQGFSMTRASFYIF